MDARQETDFSAFAAAKWGSWVRAAVFLGCDVAEAHDVAQEALVRCYRFWGRVQRADDVDGYAFRILVNVQKDSRRRARWREDIVATVPDTDIPDASETIVRSDALWRALAALPEGQREVLVLRYFAHLDEKQTARALDIAVGTVKSRLSRALDALATSPHLEDMATEVHQKEAGQ